MSVVRQKIVNDVIPRRAYQDYSLELDLRASPYQQVVAPSYKVVAREVRRVRYGEDTRDTRDVADGYVLFNLDVNARRRARLMPKVAKVGKCDTRVKFPIPPVRISRFNLLSVNPPTFKLVLCEHF